MNENSSKKILFNKSTLFSLKAELLKKQDEVKEKKLLPQHKVENYKCPKSIEEKKEAKSEKKTLKDNLVQKDVKELEENKKIRSALEKKAELYEHLSDGAGSSAMAGRFLVDFDTKKQSEAKKELTPEPEIVEPDVYNEDDDSDWVEFTDCLGRTRKCLKSDVDLYKKRDLELMRAMAKERGEDLQPELNQEPGQGAEVKEMPLIVQKTNDYLQSLRVKWEQKERELMAQDRDIHYQDLLFDEARMHGVGYYSFSTDESKRSKQMEELIRLREETLKAQKEAEERRTKRDEMMAARIAAARARRRLRAGLPPEDPEEQKKAFNECLQKLLNQQRNEVEEKTKEEEKKKKEEMEKERQKIRDTYVREWDVGKEGIEGPKKFREMTQEEYVEQQRSKRIDEFAPPKNVSHNASSKEFDSKGSFSNEPGSSKPKSWSEVRPQVPQPPPPDIGPLPEDNKGLYFSSKKQPGMKYKNFVKAPSPEPTPIVNELSDDEDDDQEETRKPEKRKSGMPSAEIAPPPTYDYYGPTAKNPRSKKPFDSDMMEAYNQGSESMKRKQSDRQLSKAYDFIM